ncbi:hypothetical protein [Marinobacterium jannaschii]|uniref:hypothetical protein n=1 Tax=Marinobacterium jannaschii TaxID=64970 RepID=UPI00047F7210|nr:hypothetical protein [Marinobacterium jannaschii]
MHQQQIQTAAEALRARRLNDQLTARLAEPLRPDSCDDALAIQQALTGLMAATDPVAGWKCALPISEGPIVAPIFASTVCSGAECPILPDQGRCKVEPEIAFCFGQDLPVRDAPYSEAEVEAALSGANLALELIRNRYLPEEEASFAEHLADCLFNQGLYNGPEVALDKAFAAAEIELTLTVDGDSDTARTLAGRHPNGLPQTPLLWLVNFLNDQGIGIKAGQQAITSSYAGVIEVEAGKPFTLQFGELGSIETRLALIDVAQ